MEGCYSCRKNHVLKINPIKIKQNHKQFGVHSYNQSFSRSLAQSSSAEAAVLHRNREFLMDLWRKFMPLLTLLDHLVKGQTKHTKLGTNL